METFEFKLLIDSNAKHPTKKPVSRIRTNMSSSPNVSWKFFADSIQPPRASYSSRMLLQFLKIGQADWPPFTAFIRVLQIRYPENFDNHWAKQLRQDQMQEPGIWRI